MASAWSDKYETGNDVVDNQHQELFEMTELLDQIIDGQQDLDRIVIFLESHMLDHLKEEEAMMERLDYSEKEQHQQDHDAFKRRVLDIRKESETKHQTQLYLTIRKLIDDLVDHIKTVDIGLAEVKRKNQVKSSLNL